jgi:hypothetical protein
MRTITASPTSSISPVALEERPDFGREEFDERRPVKAPGRSYSIAEVAALPTERILGMTRSELIGVIRSVRGRHLRPGVVERLPQMDDDTLQKLVFLTRRYCRNQQLLSEPDAPASLVAAYCG